MTTDRQSKIKELRTKLSSLNESQRNEIIKHGIVTNIDGHILSLHNTLLVHLQSSDFIPSVVAGFNQWIKQGKAVKRGQHGIMIFFPVGNKNDDNEVISPTNFYTATVFDISQVMDIGTQPIKQPEIKTQPETRQLVTVGSQTESKTTESNELMRGFEIIS
jgi:hypothetical protein